MLGYIKSQHEEGLDKSLNFHIMRLMKLTMLVGIFIIKNKTYNTSLQSLVKNKK